MRLGPVELSPDDTVALGAGNPTVLGADNTVALGADYRGALGADDPAVLGTDYAATLVPPVSTAVAGIAEDRTDLIGQGGLRHSLFAGGETYYSLGRARPRGRGWGSSL